MSYESSGGLTMPHPDPAQVGTMCDCGVSDCPDFAIHDRERRGSESDWMRAAREPANWGLAGEAA